MFGRKLAYQAAKAAYVKDAAPLPGGWFPVVSTDTLKAWRGVGNQLLIALRGTADMRDVRADAGCQRRAEGSMRAPRGCRGQRRSSTCC